MATLSTARRSAPGLHFSPATLRVTARAAAALAAVVALKSFVIDPLTGHYGGTLNDFSIYLAAAHTMAAGGSPYAHFDPNTVVMDGFDYPPFAALLIRPLALVGAHSAGVIWLALMLAATVAAAVIVARTALPAAWPRVELGVIAALAFGPAAYSFWIGQINGLVFLLVALAYRDYVRERQVRVGVLLGLAAAIKVGPVILVLLLLRRRWWRGAAAMTASGLVATAAALPLIGFGALQTFIGTVLPTLGRPTGWIYNQTAAASISRVASWSVLAPDPASAVIQFAGLAAGIAVIAIALAAVRTGSRSRSERGAEFAAAVMAMLLCGSLAWYSHFLLLLIPIFAATALAHARGWRHERRLVAATATAVAVFAVVAPLAIARLSMPGLVQLSHSPAWWPLLQLFSLPSLSAVWLLLEMSRSLRTNPQPHALEMEGAGRGITRPASRKGYQAS